MSLLDMSHYLVYLLPMAYVVLSGSTEYYDLIIAFFICISIHWAFLRDECVINYFRKIRRDRGLSNQ